MLKPQICVTRPQCVKRVSVLCGGNNEPTVLNSKVSGLEDSMSSTSRQVFGQEGDSRSSSIPTDCTLSQQKWWTTEVKIDSRALEGTFSVPSCRDKKSHDHNLRKKSKCVLQNCIRKTVPDLSDSDFTTHETDEFIEEDVSEDGLACITYPLEPNDFVVLKLANKENSEIFCWADRINGA